MSALRVGTLCYATNSGLGILAKSFVDNGIVTDPYVVIHTAHRSNLEWYPKAPCVPHRDITQPQQRRQLESWIKGLDVLLSFETPFDYFLIDIARRAGVKTVLMTMFECTPEHLPETPDEFWAPSLLDMREFADPGVKRFNDIRFFESWAGRYMNTTTVFTPVPVSVPWRQRTEAQVFVHNAGHGGLKGRNGTREFLHALQFVESPAQFFLRTQKDEADIRTMVKFLQDSGKDIIHFVGETPYEHLWDDGDVFIFPEKFNGLSLPLQEARAAGMLVMCGDRFPMNTWLPPEPLIQVADTRRNRIGPPYRSFDEAIFNPRDIAAKIDDWFGKDIGGFSEGGMEWAASMSWEALKPGYVAALERLVSS